MQVVGFKASSFKVPDTGAQISGYNLYLTEERDGVTGVAVERAFLSDRKLAGYVPQVGDELHLNYNRFGKIDSMQLVSKVSK